jgi:hypothetical protein
MKNYIVTLFVKTQLHGSQEIFTCVVKGKKNYVAKASSILFESTRASFFVDDSMVEWSTELEEGTILRSSL